MSRNPHKPTTAKRQRVRRLAGAGLPQEEIAAILGCSGKTLRLHYRDELNEGVQDANAAVREALFKSIRAGSTAAMIFYEKAKGGKREKIKEEITGPGGGPVRVRPHVEITATCPEHECDEIIDMALRRALQLGDAPETIEDDIRKVKQKMEEIWPNA